MILAARMSDQLAVAGLLFAIVGPWAMGAVWLHWWLAWSGKYNIYVILGYGYVLGMLGVGLLLRMWQTFFGFELHYWSLAGLVTALMLLGLALHWVRPPKAPLQLHWQAVPRWHLALIALLMSLLVWRYIGLLEVLLLQPAFSPAAEMGQALRAIVWFHNEALVPLNSAAQWWSQSSPVSHPVPLAATTAPEAVSLIHLWGMLSIGSSDHSFVYLPWICLPVALGFGVFGHLRLAQLRTLHAAIATYGLLGLPVLNHYSAMAGYSAVWLAAVFTLAVCASHLWRETRHWSYGLLALLLAFACALVQHSGIIFGYIVVVGMVLGAFHARGITQVALAAIALMLALTPVVWILWSGLPTGQVLPGIAIADLPVRWRAEGLGAASGVSGHAVLEYLARDRHWHLLWYAALLIALVGIVRGQGWRLLQAEWVVLIAAMIWAVVHGYGVAVHTGYPLIGQITPSLLVVAPSLVFCLGLFGAGLSRRE